MVSIDPVHNADFIPIAKADVEHSIPELFRQRTERFADRVAVESSAKSYTYRAFNAAANRIAHAVIDQLGRANEPVAILISEMSDAVVAIFAALKAGKIYLPLDPTLPMARLRYLIQDSQARLIVAENATLATALQLSSGGACSILNIDHLSDASGPTDDRHLPITPIAWPRCSTPRAPQRSPKECYRTTAISFTSLSVSRTPIVSHTEIGSLSCAL